jgi:mannosyltransferase
LTGSLKKHWALAVMTAILLLSSALRFSRIDAQSFWNDEGNSARLSERSIPLIIEGTASDIHPPLYYLMLHGWRSLTGDSELSLRMLSAFLGLILVAATYALGRRLLGPGSKPIAVIASLIVAVNPALVYYSQETRMYELMALLAVLSSLLLIRLIAAPARRGLIAVLYGLCLAAGLYTHYFFPTIIVTQLLFLVIWFLTTQEKAIGDRRRKLLAVAAGLVLAFLLYLPWIPITIRQATGRETARAGLPDFLVDIWNWLLLGGFISDRSPDSGTNWIMILLALIAVAGLFLAVMRSDFESKNVVIVLLFAALPIVAMWILGSTKPEFFKFMLMSIPWIAILLAIGYWLLWTRLKASNSGYVGIIFLIFLGMLFLLLQAQSLQNMFFDPDFARSDYRGIAERIEDANYPNAAIVLNAANQWEVFTYYHPEDAPGSAPVFPLPRGYPDPRTIDRELSSIAAEHDRVYALFWGETERDPQRLVERWLDENAFKAQDEWVGDVRFTTYALTGGGIPELGQEVDLAFGEDIILERYNIDTGSLSAGEIVAITLFWQTQSNLDQRYKVFLHLVDSGGHIITQRDSEPGGGLALTPTWIPGETVVDNHGLLLPDDIVSGEYQVVLGLYDLEDPSSRLTVHTQSGVQDSYPLAKVTIR